MKQTRDAVALAASLTNAANAPLPLPQRATPSVVSMPQRVETPKEEALEQETPPPKETAQPRKATKVKIMSDTVGITLRPSRELLNDYIVAAAERTKTKGRVVSAQEIMIEVLERGRSRVQK